MLELIQLLQAGLATVAVTSYVVVVPAAIMSGTPLPDISPVLEMYDDTSIGAN